MSGTAVDPATNVQVTVRVRPFIVEDGATEDEPQSVVAASPESKTVSIHAGRDSRVNGTIGFKFDNVLWSANGPDSDGGTPVSQEDVYRSVGEPVLQGALKGFNGCIMAYGQTGSGKTFTMLGTKAEPGIVPRMFDDIFARIAALSNAEGETKSQWTVELGVVEVYNEKIADLLAKGRGGEEVALHARDFGAKGVWCKDQHFEPVLNATSALDELNRGLETRRVAATKCNRSSSRSHAIVQLNLRETRTRIQKSGAPIRNPGHDARIFLVDLAGSERPKKSGATGERLAEAQSINTSLLVLGKVIDMLGAMARGSTLSTPPYRDSKLTYLLRDAFGGNCVTKLVAAVSPSGNSANESLNTLRYASRARLVKQSPQANEDPQARRIRELEDRVAALKAELSGRPSADGTDELVDRIKAAEEEATQRALALEAEQRSKLEAERRLQEIQAVLDKRAEIEHQLDDMERNAREKEQELERLVREHHDLATRVPELEAEVADARSTITTMESEIIHLQAVEERLKKGCQELEQERRRLSATADELQQEIDRVSDLLSCQAERSSEQLAQLKDEKVRLETDLSAAASRLSRFEDLDTQMRAMRTKVARDQLERVEIAEAAVRNESVVAYLEQREVALAPIAKVLLELQQDVQRSAENDAMATISQLQAQLGDAAEQQRVICEQLQTELDAAREDAATEAAKVTELGTVVQQQVDNIGGLKAECDALRASLADKQATIKAAEVSLEAAKRRARDAEAVVAGLRPLRRQTLVMLEQFVVRLKSVSNLRSWGVTRDTFSQTWRVANALCSADAAAADESGATGLLRTQSEVLERSTMDLHMSELAALLAVEKHSVSLPQQAGFFAGDQPRQSTAYAQLENLVFLCNLFCEADQSRASAAMDAFTSAINGLHSAMFALLHRDTASEAFGGLVQHVLSVERGDSTGPTGRTGFTCLAAADELLSILIAALESLVEAFPADFHPSSLSVCAESIEAELRQFFRTEFEPVLRAATADVEKIGRALVTVFERIRGTHDQHGNITSLGAKSALLLAVLNDIAEELLAGARTMEAKLAVRDFLSLQGKDDVLRLRPLAALDAIDLHTIARAWTHKLAAEHTFVADKRTAEIVPAPADQVSLLKHRGEEVDTALDALVTKHFTMQLLETDSSGMVHVTATNLKNDAQDAAAKVKAAPRDPAALAELIAASCAVTTYCMTPRRGISDFVEGGCQTRGLLLVPHAIQVSAVMRVFGMHLDTPDFVAAALTAGTTIKNLNDFPANHLLEVATGQGKSILFAVLAVAMGLLGIQADVVCFNRLLSRRDRAAVRGFGRHNGFNYFLERSAPRFLTFTELAFAQAEIPRDVVRRAFDVATGASPSGTAAVTGPHNAKRLVFIDEVDAFFDIAGAEYAAGVKIECIEARRVVKKLCKELVETQGIISEARQANFVNELATALGSAIPSSLAAVVAKQSVAKFTAAAVTVANEDAADMHGHEIRDHCKLGMTDESDFFDPSFRDQYLAPMIYWREVQRAGGLLQEARCAELCDDVHSLRVALPSVTYAWLLQQCYFGVIGASGTLRTLSSKLMDYMQEHVIGSVTRRTFVPPLHTVQGGRSAAAGAQSRVDDAMLEQANPKTAWPHVSPAELVCRTFDPRRALYRTDVDAVPFAKQISQAANEEAAWRHQIILAIREHRGLRGYSGLDDGPGLPRSTVGGGQVLVVFENAARMTSFLNSTQGKNLCTALGVDATVVLGPGLSESDVAERVDRAMNPRTVTFLTRSYGRGTDFKARKRDVVLVVQTFVSTTSSEEIQIRGRTARADRAGRYVLIFAPSHAAEVLQEMTKEDAVAEVAKSTPGGETMFSAPRAAMASNAVEELEAARDHLMDCSAGFSALYAACDQSEADSIIDLVTAANTDRQAGHNEVALENARRAVVTFVIDCCATMAQRVEPTSNVEKKAAVVEAMTRMYERTLRKLGPVQWRVVIYFGENAETLAKGSFDDAAETPHGALGSRKLPSSHGKWFFQARGELEKLFANEDKSLPDEAQHYIFWFTDGRPMDFQLSNRDPPVYDDSLYEPSQAQYNRFADRIVKFHLCLLDRSDDPRGFQKMQTFAECYGGTASKTADATSLQKNFADFGTQVRTALR